MKPFALSCRISRCTAVSVSGVTKAQRTSQWQHELNAAVVIVGRPSDGYSKRARAGAYAVGVTYGMGSREELSGADGVGATARRRLRIAVGD
ncbi:MAG: hypothetical protein ACLUHE_04810 [Christensenellales bacterium]